MKGIICLTLLLVLNNIFGHSQNRHEASFAYDKTAPLDWMVMSFVDTAGCSIEETSFMVKEHHMADMLIIKKRDGSVQKPVIIFQHWGGGDKFFFRQEAVLAAQKGFYCISLSAPWHWTTLKDTANFFYTYPKFIHLSVIAIKRLLDSLTMDSHFDKVNIYYIGHSYGGTLGGLLSGIESRIKGGILMAGLPSIFRSMMEGRNGVWKRQWEADSTGFLRIAADLARIEPENYITKSKWKIYHQIAIHDEYVKMDYSKKLLKKTPKPYKVSFYKSGHLFNQQSMADRLHWIFQQTKGGLIWRRSTPRLTYGSKYFVQLSII